MSSSTHPPRRFHHRRLLLSLSLVAAPLTASLTSPSPADGASDPVLVGAGDIGTCPRGGDDNTGKLLDDISGTVFTLGDNAYPDGTAKQFKDCYGPAWGRHKGRTRPAAGNHDYGTGTAAAYFDYFGAAAGPRGKGYYSYDLGEWHIIVLNSNCSKVGGCFRGSEQEKWLRADLAANPERCTLAYWHHARFSSDSSHGNTPATGPFWDALYEAGADVVLSGHAHTYERFAPQGPAGKLDWDKGIRQFVVGSGGVGFSTFGAAKPTSQVRNRQAFGVLKLTLHDGSYDWTFVPVAGRTFTDAGHWSCHGKP